jgi:hypothetical protein
MQRFIVTAVLALGPVTLRAVMLPLTTQPVSTSSSPAMSKALFLCRTQQGIDQTCTAALAKALVIGQPKQNATDAADRTCHTAPTTIPDARP